MRKPIAISVVGSLFLGLLVAGCGGDDSADAGQIDKGTFIRQANRICEEVSGKLAADIASINRREQASRESDFEKTQIAMVEEGLLPRLEEELKRIRALGIPEEAKRGVESLLRAYQKGIKVTKRKARLVALTERVAPHEVIAVTGTRLGVTECPISPVNVNASGAN